jgi:hypothetical protein
MPWWKEQPRGVVRPNAMASQAPERQQQTQQPVTAALP